MMIIVGYVTIFKMQNASFICNAILEFYGILFYDFQMFKELELLVDSCTVGCDISNFQIRSFLIVLAKNIKQMYYETTEANNNKERQIRQQVSRWLDCELMKLQQNQQRRIDEISAMINHKLNLFQELDEKIEKTNSIFNKAITKFAQQIQQDMNHAFKMLSEKATIEQLFTKDKELDEAMKKWSGLLNKEIQKIQFNYSKDMQYLTGKVIRIEDDIEQRISKQIKCLKTNDDLKIKNSEYFEKKFIYVFEWVHPSFLQCIDVERNKINAKKPSLILSKHRCEDFYVGTFLINKIVKSVGFGVIGSQYIEEKNNLLERSLYNNIRHQSNCGFIQDHYFAGMVEGDFKQGDIVTMSVDLIIGYIEWRVGCLVKNKRFYKNLRDKAINWVPYIFFSGKDESVNILQS